MFFALVAAAALTPPSAPMPALAASPAAVTLRHPDASRQLLLTESVTNAPPRDRTDAATYAVADPEVAAVDKAGRVTPLANGTTAVTATFAGRSVTVPVTVEVPATLPAMSFTHDIEPILTKLSCNAGGCHGKIAGQNGFRLSLLGYDPELDHLTLVKEGRGRRLVPAAPERSPFLLKAAGQVPHGGGKKTEVGSEEYKVLTRWIAGGMPFGTPADPVLTKVTVAPEARVVARGAKQQLAVLAHYSDGRVDDVTRRAQYESHETDVAVVTEAGAVQALQVTGQASVMVRFNGQVTVFRATVPQPGTPADFAFQADNAIDKATSKKWRELGIAPSALCSDEEYLRRVTLDVTGTLPTVAAVRAFLADTRPDKRERLVDTLLASPEYAALFANKWADVLRVKRGGRQNRATGTFAFHGWIVDRLANDTPFDRFARDIVTATGTESQSPPTVWLREVTTPEHFADDVSQVFLGQRMACANCHHHPYEKWTQDDYWGLAAVFGRVARKPAANVGRNPNDAESPAVYTKAGGGVTNKRTGQAAILHLPDGPTPTLSADDDPRQVFAEWMTARDNPFFAKAVVNRYWAHFLGRGIVDPLDDMRVTNPPSNPELLDALATQFVADGYSLKALVRRIVTSKTYQLSAVPNASNALDKQSYARYYPRRLPAEVVYDALSQLTGTPPDFPGLPKDRNAPRRTLQLPDESFASYFLDVLGRPARNSACECERVGETSLAMTLHLLNSQDVQDKLSRSGGLADRLARDPRPVDERLDELFVAVVGKPPSDAQRKTAKAHLATMTGKEKAAFENVLWALLNGKTFLFNQ